MSQTGPTIRQAHLNHISDKPTGLPLEFIRKSNGEIAVIIGEEQITFESADELYDFVEQATQFLDQAENTF